LTNSKVGRKATALQNDPKLQFGSVREEMRKEELGLNKPGRSGTGGFTVLGIGGGSTLTGKAGKRGDLIKSMGDGHANLIADTPKSPGLGAMTLGAGAIESQLVGFPGAVNSEGRTAGLRLSASSASSASSSNASGSAQHLQTGLGRSSSLISSLDMGKLYKPEQEFGGKSIPFKGRDGKGRFSSGGSGGQGAASPSASSSKSAKSSKSSRSARSSRSGNAMSSVDGEGEDGEGEYSDQSDYSQHTNTLSESEKLGDIAQMLRNNLGGKQANYGNPKILIGAKSRNLNFNSNSGLDDGSNTVTDFTMHFFNVPFILDSILTHIGYVDNY
jgi:hypothetical protein